MGNFKITSAKGFNGMSIDVLSLSNQVVSLKEPSFYKGELGKGLSSKGITLIIPSRVYINETSCTDVDTKEAEIVTLKTQQKAKFEEWSTAVDTYTNSNKPEDAAKARKLHIEGSAIELDIKTKSDLIDRSSYYDHTTKVELEDAAALVTALADTRLVVKADDLFKGDTVVDL